MIVAIIPARGGSKRISNKNKKEFAGRPLIAHSISAANEAEIFDKVVVSTDSADIADIARKWGAEVPFMRPADLADDHTPTLPVIMHAIDWLMEHAISVEYFCCIYANPFVTVKNLLGAFYLLKDKQVSSVIPVTTFPFPILRGFKISEKGTLEFIWPEYALSRSQDLPEAYHDAGQFFWCDCKKVLVAKQILQSDSLPLIIPRYLSQDLDTPEDWEMAEKLYHTFMIEK